MRVFVGVSQFNFERLTGSLGLFTALSGLLGQVNMCRDMPRNCDRASRAGVGGSSVASRVARGLRWCGVWRHAGGRALSVTRLSSAAALGRLLHGYMRPALCVHVWSRLDITMYAYCLG